MNGWGRLLPFLVEQGVARGVVVVLVVVALVQARGLDFGLGFILTGSKPRPEDFATAGTGWRICVLISEAVCFFRDCCCCSCPDGEDESAAHFTSGASSRINFRLSCSCLLLFTAVFTRLEGVILGNFSLSELNTFSSEGTKIPGFGNLDISVVASVFLRSLSLFVPVPVVSRESSGLFLCVPLGILFVLAVSSVLGLFLRSGA